MLTTLLRKSLCQPTLFTKYEKYVFFTDFYAYPDKKDMPRISLYALPQMSALK